MKKEKVKKISFRVSERDYNIAQELKKHFNLSEICREAFNQLAKQKGIA